MDETASECSEKTYFGPILVGPGLIPKTTKKRSSNVGLLILMQTITETSLKKRAHGLIC